MTRSRREVHEQDPQEPPREPGTRERERLDRAARRHQLGRPEVTELEVGDRTYRVAEVEPLDVDGVRTMVVGAGLWLVAGIALLPFLGTLQDGGRVWWLWTCLAGFGLGTIGIEYCRRRRRALDHHPERRRSDTSPLGPAGL
ncbi:MAG: DUF2530 domain-containing protein [Nocardioidaceae bacterium]|nr:DUF2530 domain-containing protein [Nocardioidaceae bacterium]